ncbi:MAG: hypothetical protein KDA25_06370, partial [Phycisphaerales bacterium]|nr:hypothetical protein [Phycisphaerales bacterium]
MMTPSLLDLTTRALAASGTAATTADATFWLPERASSTAAFSDWMFYFILWVSVFFFVAIV